LGYFSAAQNADNDDDNDDAAMYAAAAARFERTQAAKEASRQRVEVQIAVRGIIYQKDAQDQKNGPRVLALSRVLDSKTA
jgi:predicted RNA-binding Zn ribbon-like protein